MNRELRIGDQERDAAVTALGEHYVAGRLTKDEFDERTAVAWKARTNSELAPLFDDLPPLPAPQPKAQPKQLTAQPGRPRPGGGVPVLPVLVLVLVVAMASGLDIWPLLLVLVLYFWVKAAYWRRRAWWHQKRPTVRSMGPDWQHRRPY